MSIRRITMANHRISFVRTNDFKILLLSLGVALTFGLIFIFLFPPWQHYDEPNHFEYAWLLTNNRRIPERGDFDIEMNRLVVESMVRHGFYGDLKDQPDLSGDEDVRIEGFHQFDEPPFYYLAVSIPMSLLSTSTIESQLYGARFVSLLFYLVTVTAAWGIAREITRAGSPVRWMLPLLAALLPGLVDLMTAVNNDAAAIAVVSLFLWVGVRMIKRGFSFTGLVLLILLSGIALFTKGTALIIVPLTFLVIVLSLFRGKWLFPRLVTEEDTNG